MNFNLGFDDPNLMKIDQNFSSANLKDETDADFQNKTQTFLSNQWLLKAKRSQFPKHFTHGFFVQMFCTKIFLRKEIGANVLIKCWRN